MQSRITIYDFPLPIDYWKGMIAREINSNNGVKIFNTKTHDEVIDGVQRSVYEIEFESNDSNLDLDNIYNNLKDYLRNNGGIEIDGFYENEI